MQKTNWEDKWIYHHPEGDYIVFDERGEFVNFSSSKEKARKLVKEYIDKNRRVYNEVY